MKQKLRQGSEFLRFVIGHFLRDQCTQHAAALTYTTLFAVVPVMTVTFTLLAAVPSLSSVSQDVQAFVFENFVPATGEVVQQHLRDFAHQAAQLTAVGVAMLFVTAIMMLMTIEKAFNRIWKVRRARPGLVGFLRYWAVLSLGPVLLGLGFAVTSYLASHQLLSGAASVITHAVPGLQLMPFIFSVAAFVLLYVAVPNCHVPLRAGLVGGVSAAILFEIAKGGFAYFVSSFPSYKLIYGAFAAFPLFLLWIYLSWVIVLLGVEISRAVAIWHATYARPRHPVVALMQLMQLLHDARQRGESISDIEGMAVLQTSDQEDWTIFIEQLEAQRLVARTEEGNYLLSRDLDTLSFHELLRHLPWPMPQVDDLHGLPEGQVWAGRLQEPLAESCRVMENRFSMTLGSLFARNA